MAVNHGEYLYHGAPYHEGTLVVRIKPEYRTSCLPGAITHPKFLDALNKISSSDVQKRFPKWQPIPGKLNRGRKPIDLSLVYTIRFSPVVRIEEAMDVMMKSGVLVYAEPVYIHQGDFTPNDPNITQQYFLAKISAYNAWDFWTGDTLRVIGIVDSGTDWDHPDLAGNIAYNYADPIDGQDNDLDGFVDNFRGWDVSDNDNNPMVGVSGHGSHVSGCAAAVTNNATGVASPGYNCRFLPVKSAMNTSASSIDNGYDGIVYAADHGCSVINCSWGRSGLPSIFEQEIVDYATFDKDALVIAAAGNDGLDGAHYPASYASVLSVASTGSSDTKSGFSNYHATVDVSAPGSNIYSTYVNDTYRNESGTSMASPIAAGCAAMVRSRFPAMNALQAAAQLRTTCDDIYPIGSNNNFRGKLGSGRVNLFKAVTDSVSPGVLLKEHIETDGNDDVFLANDTLSIFSLLENLLRPTANLQCTLSTTSPYVQVLQANYSAGVVGSMDTVSNYASPYRVKINAGAPLNSEVLFYLTLNDNNWRDEYVFSIVVNVDYVNVAVNKVATSVTSKSLIGYNQTGQSQGLGFTYLTSPTILYDMGLMVGAAGTQVSDNMRASSGNDEDFKSINNVTFQEPGPVSDFDVTGLFRDNGPTSGSPLNIYVRHNAYAWTAAPDDNYVMVQYYIRNNGANTYNNLWAGLFADWDIPDYNNNKCSTDPSNRMGYIWSTDSAGLWGGMKLLSHTAGFNHYALDNTANNGGINMTDGYDNSEKYTSLSTARANSGTATVPGNDVLSVVSSGPFTLAPGDSIEVAFALIAGTNLLELQEGAAAAQAMYDSRFVGIIHAGPALEEGLHSVFPNPSINMSTVEFSLTDNGRADLAVYSMLGERMKVIMSDNPGPGRYRQSTDISDLPAGNYFYRLITQSQTGTLPFTIIR